MTWTRKPLARTRRALRRSLAFLLPQRATDAVHAAYLGRWWLSQVGDAGEPDLVVAKALLQAGDTALDGGANFGRYADTFAAVVGPRGVVLAIEPIPRTATLLRRVLRHRKRSQVAVLEVALAAAPGTGSMEVPAGPGGDDNYFRAHITDVPGAGGAIPVVLDTLDHVAERLPRPPALVKLDLEGHERAALAGAAALLRAGAAWLIEMNDDPDAAGTDAAAIEAQFSSIGYTCWTFDARSETMARRGPRPRGPNVFFLLPAHIEKLRASGVTVDDRGGVPAP